MIKTNRTPILKNNVFASTTVEAAIVIPLFIYAVIAISFMLQILAIRIKVNNALYNCLRDYAGYAYVYQQLESLSDSDKEDVESKLDKSEILSDGLSEGAFLVLFIKEIGTDFASNNNIVGDNIGWVLLESSILDDDSDIEIVLRYVVKNPFNIFGFGDIVVSEKKVTRAWLGEVQDSNNNESSKLQKKGKLVYITTNGSVYHTNRECTYISRNINVAQIGEVGELRNLNGEKYSECTICKRLSNSGKVYYTDYGNKYHNTFFCTELNRVVISIPLSEVGGRKECTKCASNGDG